MMRSGHMLGFRQTKADGIEYAEWFPVGTLTRMRSQIGAGGSMWKVTLVFTYATTTTDISFESPDVEQVRMVIAAAQHFAVNGLNEYSAQIGLYKDGRV